MTSEPCWTQKPSLCFRETVTVIYDSMQLHKLNLNITLDFFKQYPCSRKINDSWAEIRAFRKPPSLFLFSSITWRYGQR
jgi:hypothetical protein